MRSRVRVLAAGFLIGLMLTGVGIDTAMATHDGTIGATEIVGDLQFPSMFTFASDGRIFYSQLGNGEIGLYNPADQSKSTYYDVPGVCLGEAAEACSGSPSTPGSPPTARSTSTPTGAPTVTTRC